jgi:hypothetical protein
MGKKTKNNVNSSASTRTSTTSTTTGQERQQQQQQQERGRLASLFAVAGGKPGPGWNATLSIATAANVRQLPKVNQHGWMCMVFHHESSDATHPHGVLGIMDITNRIRGESNTGRCMAMGGCPDPITEYKDLVLAIFATMMGPATAGGGRGGGPRNDDEYYRPRRPGWIILDEELMPSYAYVREALAEVGVDVRLNKAESLQLLNKNTNNNNGSSTNNVATWHAGFAIGATVENVRKLPQFKKEIWKCTMSMDELIPGSGKMEAILAVEDVSHGFPVGIGPCVAATINPEGMVRAILATMLSPMIVGDERDAGAGAGYFVQPRRPGRIILDEWLQEWLDLVRAKLVSIDVDVTMESCDATEYCGACGRRNVPLSKCSACGSIAYCGRECQRLHWKTHKKDCSNKR